MGLPSSVSFRASQIDPTSILPVAPRQADASDDQDRFQRHLDENRSRDDRKVDRRDDRRQRDRTESTRDAKKTDTQDTQPQKDANDAADNTAAPVVPVAQPLATVTPDTKTAQTGNAVVKTDKTDAAPAPDASTLVPADKAGDAKTDAAKDAADALTPKAADTTASKTDEKKPKVDEKAEAPDLTSQAPVAPHIAARADAQAHKAETKPDVAQAVAPVPASQTPLVAAAANADTDADASKTSTDGTDPDAGLTIKSKDGLGHEAAASLAEKSDTKTAAAPTAQQNAQTQNPQATAAPTFAKMVAAATGGEVTSVTATDSGDTSGAARLTDLQNVGNNTQNQNSATATVRIGTLPGQTTPTQVPAMAIALQVARNLQKGVNRFDIRLDPAEMGRIDVRMEVKKDGNVAAHLTVDRPETLDLLKRDSSALQQALNDAGLQANADSLNFSLRDQNAGSNARDFGADAAATSSTGGTATAEEAVAGPLYNINLSASGGVDIRV